ncbi:MAG: hypothetical protein WA885_05870 [Phormidesmis sp.]
MPSTAQKSPVRKSLAAQSSVATSLATAVPVAVDSAKESADGRSADERNADNRPAADDRVCWIEVKQFPYQPDHQVELLHLQAEADALLIKLQAASQKRAIEKPLAAETGR